jgi:hypothetical protein
MFARCRIRRLARAFHFGDTQYRTGSGGWTRFHGITGAVLLCVLAL